MAKGEALTPEDWIRAGTEALAEGGLAAVRVEALARRLGVTKGSFYWHFANRKALIEGILESWRQRQTLSIIEQVERGAAGPTERLHLLAKLTENDGEHPVDLALRDEGSRNPEIAAFVAQVDATRMGFLHGLFQELGCSPIEAHARSLLCYSLLIGDYFISAGRAEDRQAELAECRRLLFRSTEGSPSGID